jgi:mannose/fructose-specific phosphotransferase system component IIA
MSEVELLRGVVLAHGRMAEGLVNAVERISGVDDALVPLSNEGQGPETLRTLLDEAVGDSGAIVFTDMAAGSCGMAAVVTCRDRGRRAVVCGVNLPLLLDFVFHREMPLDELVARLVGKGRESIYILP